MKAILTRRPGLFRRIGCALFFLTLIATPALAPDNPYGVLGLPDGATPNEILRRLGLDLFDPDSSEGTILLDAVEAIRQARDKARRAREEREKLHAARLVAERAQWLRRGQEIFAQSTNAAPTETMGRISDLIREINTSERPAFEVSLQRQGGLPRGAGSEWGYVPTEVWKARISGLAEALLFHQDWFRGHPNETIDVLHALLGNVENSNSLPVNDFRWYAARHNENILRLANFLLDTIFGATVRVSEPTFAEAFRYRFRFENAEGASYPILDWLRRYEESFGPSAAHALAPLFPTGTSTEIARQLAPFPPKIRARLIHELGTPLTDRGAQAGVFELFFHACTAMGGTR